MSITAFQLSASANSALIAASSSTASAPTQVSTGGQQGMYLANPSTVPVYAAFGSSLIQAGCPTTAVPCPGVCVLPGQSVPFTVPPQGWLSAVTSAGNASLFATPGFFGT